MIFFADAIFENRLAQPTYMKNMSRKSKIQKVKTRWLVFWDVFAHYFCPLFLSIIFVHYFLCHYFCPLFLSIIFCAIIFAHYFLSDFLSHYFCRLFCRLFFADYFCLIYLFVISIYIFYMNIYIR